MLRRLKLERFKNFESAELFLGPLTILVGTNASGKSNIRDAFRFLHGISRGYTLAEIIGEKWIEGGVLQWRGIRGGTRETSFRQAETFALEVEFDITDEETTKGATYRIEVKVGKNGAAPQVAAERLIVEGRGDLIYDSHPESDAPPQNDPLHLAIKLHRGGQKGRFRPPMNLFNDRPLLSQLAEHPAPKRAIVKTLSRSVMEAFSSMRFLDLAPDAMRIPSLPGQKILGDRGENLSSVLQAICANEQEKSALLEWIREMTPMDAKDFLFPPDQTGRVLVSLVEEGGQETSAYSASDGTLRFLAMIAALLGPQPAKYYFFEELENGIHPTRLSILLQLIEQKVGEGGIQMVATSHSPQLLGFVSPEGRKNAALVYRLADHSEARIRRIMDMPDVARLIHEQSLARLHSSGWLENAVSFLEDSEKSE